MVRVLMFCAAFTAGNFIYQWLGSQYWLVALERSYFQAWAVLWFWIVTR